MDEVDFKLEVTDTSDQFKDFEKHLKLNEQKTRAKYLLAVDNMRPVFLPDWFFQFIETRVIPTFNQIGLEDSLVWAIFKMAAPSWELMGQVSGKRIWFNPFFIRVIEEIKEDLQRQAENESRSIKSKETLQKLGPHIKNDIEPDEFLDLLSNISTSWLILPRAYHQLERQNARTLTGYLKYLEQESNLEFRKLMTRIVIEYVGNFALKYMNTYHVQQRMLHILFYGYATMFWKNLRNPPQGLEQMRLFEFFLSWAKNLHQRLGPIYTGMSETLKAMEMDLETIFPAANAFGFNKEFTNQLRSLVIALRHGQSGVSAAMMYFGTGGSLLKSESDGRIPYSYLPKVLWSFLQILKEQLPRETQATRENAALFLTQLKIDYSLQHTNMNDMEPEISKSLRFAAPRISRMINEFSSS